jgi:hypothetical protein
VKIHFDKKGIRTLGIAESFQKGSSENAILAGVVMRGDLQIDGFAISKITIGGLDATEGVIQIFDTLNRRDINAILLNGCVISMFNIIDLEKVHSETKLPVVCVTYEESEGLDKYLKEFEDSEVRLSMYKRLGNRTPIKLHTGHEVLVRFLGAKKMEVKYFLDKFTLQGAIPEPLRVARLLARALRKAMRYQL